MLLEVDASVVSAGVEVEGVRRFVVLRFVAAVGEGRDRRVVVGSTGWDDWEEVVVEEAVMWDLLPIVIPPGPCQTQITEKQESQGGSFETQGSNGTGFGF